MKDLFWDMDKAQVQVGEMKKQGLSPNVVTYNTLINGLLMEKMDQSAKIIVDWLRPKRATQSKILNQLRGERLINLK